MSGLRGNPASLRELGQRIKKLPLVLAQDVAAHVAPKVTDLAQSAYAGGSTVYGDARPSGSTGQALDLVVSGNTRNRVRFVAIGTLVRCVLGTRYARYLVGKYRILPMGALPVAWSEAIGKVVRERTEKRVSE